MAITASMVKELREMTGAGMMDCKKALNETNGDMDAAVEFLRKNGQLKLRRRQVVSQQKVLHVQQSPQTARPLALLK